MKLLGSLVVKGAHRLATTWTDLLCLWDIDPVDHARRVPEHSDGAAAFAGRDPGGVAFSGLGSGGGRRFDHDTAIDKQAQVIDVDALVPAPKLPLEQPVQVRLEPLDQLALLIEHEVQRLHIGRVRGSAFHGDVLSGELARVNVLHNSCWPDHGSGVCTDISAMRCRRAKPTPPSSSVN